MPQEFKVRSKEALSASNRRLGFILLSIAAIFFLGILMKYSILG
ncbi:cytochrome oxidase small assembly protein [Polynucleobacter meluiroseus]|nr:cytochrome oxidase small assembly protein [Polynucleobacter meluiroseus]